MARYYAKVRKKETQYTLLHSVRARVYKAYRGQATVYYPIWWYEEPRIVDTFVESYKFSGKTVIPFCTSGGSGIGKSGSNLESFTSGAKWISGKLLEASDSQAEIADWINSLSLDVSAK